MLLLNNSDDLAANNNQYDYVLYQFLNNSTLNAK